MGGELTLERLLDACGDESFEDGIRIEADLEPISGPGGPVKPAIYEGGRYQHDRRWASPDDESPTPVIVIDNVPSQANRLEDAIRRHRSQLQVPEIVLDLSSIPQLPAHLPKQISSWQFPHRNADAYLRDAQLGGVDFLKTDLGKELFDATPWAAGPLMAWFPQALLFGFWQSHLGKKRTNTKHARSWVSEIVGWNPASSDVIAMGLKGDPLNLSTDETVTSDEDDRERWEIGKESVEGGKTDRLSEMGHGQVPFMSEDEGSPSAVSFSRVTQTATLSYAQLRRIGLGDGNDAADAAARALVAALGIHAHSLAFGRSFASRSGAELRVSTMNATWLGDPDEGIDLGADETAALLDAARAKAADEGVPLDGWKEEALVLEPKGNLRNAIEATWPELGE